MQNDSSQTVSKPITQDAQTISSDSPEIRALEAQLAAEPENTQLKQDLAIQYSQAGRKQEALDMLFTILSRDLNFGEAKKTYLDILI